MNPTNIQKFFDVLAEMIEDGMPWKEKLDLIQAHASEDNMTNLKEFISWFEELES